VLARGGAARRKVKSKSKSTIEARAEWCVMRRPLAIAFLIPLFALPALAQSSAENFYWSPKNATEIDVGQTLAASKDFSSKQKAEIARIVREQIISEYTTHDGKYRRTLADFEQTFRDIPSFMRVAQIDVDGDGEKEVVIQSLGEETCGAVGNCFVLVLKPDGKSYDVMLTSGGESFEVRRPKAGASAQIVTAGHDSASEKTLEVFELCGREFKRIAVYGYESVDHSTAEIEEFRSPKITLMKRENPVCE
jgi:hypothetical protein